jgi:5-methylthioadenosine/S-adenosylhomocysteine deaminase
VIDRYLADLVVPMDDAFSLHSPGYVDVEAGLITGVGSPSAAPPLGSDGRKHHLGGMLLPGFVNGHAHSPMTLLRGAGEGLPLERWLTEAIWPREARLTTGDVRLGMQAGAAEMLLNGITTTNEMYFFPDAVAQGTLDAGIRAIVSAAIADAPGLERFGTPEQMISRALELRDLHRGNDLLEIGLGPHSAYALGSESLQEIGALGRAEDMLIHVHVAETRAEVEGMAADGHPSVAGLLGELGVFAGRASAAHCVWVDDGDIALLAELGVGIAHCPGSNGKLASGIAPVAAMRRAGLAVGVATDGPASNNNLDLLEEARLALLYARLREEDPAILGVADALRMMTSEAARALGRTDLGTLELGRRADLVRVSTDHLAYEPGCSPEDLLAHLVWAGSARDITDVWVGGRRLVEDCVLTSLDTVALRRELRAAAERIAG